MSQQKFCHNCGLQVQLGSKFCSGCGTNLASLAFKPTPTAKTIEPVFVETDDDDPDAYLDRLTHANIKQTALHVSIIKDRQVHETLGNAIIQGAQLGKPEDVLERNKPYTEVGQEKIIADFQKEGGSLRHE